MTCGFRAGFKALTPPHLNALIHCWIQDSGLSTLLAMSSGGRLEFSSTVTAFCQRFLSFDLRHSVRSLLSSSPMKSILQSFFNGFKGAPAASCRAKRPRCLRKRYSVEADTPVESCTEDNLSSRSRAATVRLGFSRLRRSMRLASCGLIVRDCPRSWRGLGANASKPPLRYRNTQPSRLSTETDVRLE